MPLAIMAGNAFQIDTEKNLARGDGDFIVGVFLIDLARVKVIHLISDQKIGRAIQIVGARTGGHLCLRTAAESFPLERDLRQRRQTDGQRNEPSACAAGYMGRERVHGPRRPADAR